MKIDLNLQDIITDGTLRLRRTNKGDKKFFYKHLRNEKIIKHISIGPIKTLKHSKNLISKYKKRWKRFKEFVYIIEIKADNGQNLPIGSISIWNISWKHRRGELGIWIIPKFWNKGFGTSSVELVIDYAFSNLNFHRLEVHIITINKKSIRLFQKSGFEKEGLLKDYLRLNNKYYDSYIFSILNKKK